MSGSENTNTRPFRVQTVLVPSGDSLGSASAGDMPTACVPFTCRCAPPCRGRRWASPNWSLFPRGGRSLWVASAAVTRTLHTL